MNMQKKLTITIDEDVYAGLYQVVGKRKISRFIESLVRPHVIYGDIREGYRRMAADTEREAEAMEWIEGTAEDIRDEAR
jgi:predicted CopG family antitoxin